MEITLLIIHFIKYCIYCNRACRKIPTYAHLRHEYMGMVGRDDAIQKMGGSNEQSSRDTKEYFFRYTVVKYEWRCRGTSKSSNVL
jgi:hypothetical protein